MKRKRKNPKPGQSEYEYAADLRKPLSFYRIANGLIRHIAQKAYFMVPEHDRRKN